MIDIINKYRNSPNRTWLHLVMKTDFSLGGKECLCETKNALVDLKCLKRGAFTCRRELNVRLCDLCFMGATAAVLWMIANKMGKE